MYKIVDGAITAMIYKLINKFSSLNLSLDHNNFKSKIFPLLYPKVLDFLSIIKNESEFSEIQVSFNKIFESMDYACKMLKMGAVVISSHSNENIKISNYIRGIESYLGILLEDLE